MEFVTENSLYVSKLMDFPAKKQVWQLKISEELCQIMKDAQ